MGATLQRLHHKKVARFIGAAAGLTSALSVLVGVLAARWAPHGWSRFAVALHLYRQPFIVRVASVVAAIAVTVAAAAGIVSFYSWCVESRDEGSSGSSSGS
ncbi:MAG TPA: hypothetical protein VNU73_01285 [Steroidobacteraceae bacterium]|jgi:hypothetical protein|nr:hypothetical protein [Steroidobacteraceae bacterium]